MGNFRHFARLSYAASLFIALSAQAAPSIDILSTPTYGAAGNLDGVVMGVNFADYSVATYLHVEGIGWSSVPTPAAVNPDGTFSVAIPSGADSRATILATALIPKSYTPPQTSAGQRIPANLSSVAIDYQQRYSRIVQFGNYTWGIKESPGGAGPGKNSFSNSPQDIWVDNKGMHLTIQNHDNKWWATEAINTKPLGYGTYVVQTSSRVDTLDPTVAFGAFTWDAFGDDTHGPSANRELDFEDARWGYANDPTSSQFVVQPFNVTNNLVRYKVADQSANAELTRIMIWTPDDIKFLAVKGHHTATDYLPGDVLFEWTYDGNVPDPGRAAWRFNLWPSTVELGGTVPAPVSGVPQEVIVSNFLFTAAVPEASSMAMVATGLAGMLLLGVRRKQCHADAKVR